MMPDKIKVLAVDDAIANLAVIKACLRGDQFELTTQTNALDALRLFKNHFFDVVLLDVLMPGISGFELCKLMREVDKERPIIFLTSMVDDGNMTMLNQISWDPNTYYLNRVVDRQTLTLKILEVTGAHRSRQMDKLRSRKLEEELQLAGSLQGLLLPPWCIADGTIHAGSLYSPSLYTSGDIYEIIPLGNDRYLFFIGDIAGHGIAAALYMTTIQAYLKILAPSQSLTVNRVLENLNQFVCNKIGHEAYLTATAVIFDFKQNHLVLHSGGHLPLRVCSPSKGTVTELQCKSDSPPLGWFPDSRYPSSDNLEYDFQEDDIFFALTDGVYDLEDNKNCSIQQNGLAEFNELIASLVQGSDALELPSRILGTLNQIGFTNQTDDITMVAIQKQKHDAVLMEKIVPPLLYSVDQLAEQFALFSDDMRQQSQIELCIHEAINNIIIHGAKSSSDQKPIYTSIRKNHAGLFEIRIMDCGQPWDYAKKVKEYSEDQADELKTSGRGLPILQSITQSILCNSYAGLNEVIFVLKDTNLSHDSAP